jgi:hypothetical protein
VASRRLRACARAFGFACNFGRAGLSTIEEVPLPDHRKRSAWPGAAVCLAGLLLAACSDAHPGPERGSGIGPLVTRSGNDARADDVVAFRLNRMQGYMSAGRPSDIVRARVLDDQLAMALGKPGRVLMAHLLDYTHEVVAARRSRPHSRETFFHALADLNAEIEKQGLGYFLYAGFEWDERFQRVDEVKLEALAITRVRTYEAGEAGRAGERVRALHVQRLEEPRVHATKLGFTAVEYAEVFVLPRAIDAHVAEGLVLAAAPAAFTPLFPVVASDAETEWYRALRRRLAEVMAEELGGTGATLAQAARDALTCSVELHEVQHQLDYRRKPDLPDSFRALSERLDKRLVWSSMFETSAHLAQLARAPGSARTILGDIVSNTFTGDCSGADCLATLVILEEIGAELGHATPRELTAENVYTIAAVAELYVDIAQHPAADVSAAAQRAWERIFDEPLAAVRLVEP